MPVDTFDKMKGSLGQSPNIVPLRFHRYQDYEILSNTGKFPSPHQLLVCHHVGLVEADPDLVVMGPDRLDRVLELVRDVELVSVEQQDDAVSTLRKPAEITRII